MTKIIYAAYGSNLLKERFMYYIKGGRYEGKDYPGCKDKEDPVDLGYMFVPHRLYFAKKSQRWDNEGVAFLNYETEENPKFHSLVRLWKINEDQFDDVHKQEGKSLYPLKVYLGEKDGIEICTITGCWLNEENKPSLLYIKKISMGIKETINWSDKKIGEYLYKFIGK